MNKPLPFMVDALNCAEGCLHGTGVEPELSGDDDVLFEIQGQRDKAKRYLNHKKKDKKNPWAKNLSYEKRFENFNAQFAGLRLEDFLCTYRDMSKSIQINSQLTNSGFAAMCSCFGNEPQRELHAL